MRVKSAWLTGRRDCIVYTQLLTICSSTGVKPAWLTGTRDCKVYTQLLTICSSMRVKPAWLIGRRDCIVYTHLLTSNCNYPHQKWDNTPAPLATTTQPAWAERTTWTPRTATLLSLWSDQFGLFSEGLRLLKYRCLWLHVFTPLEDLNIEEINIYFFINGKTHQKPTKCRKTYLLHWECWWKRHTIWTISLTVYDKK